MANRISPPADDSICLDLGPRHTVAHMKANPGVRTNVRRSAEFIATQIELQGEWVFSNGRNWQAHKDVVTAVRWLEANGKIARSGGPDYCPIFRTV